MGENRVVAWLPRAVLVIFLVLAGQAALAEDPTGTNAESTDPLPFFEWTGKNSVLFRGHYVNDVDGINPTFRAYNEFCLNLDATLETGTDPKLCYYGFNEGGWIDGEPFYFGAQIVRFHSNHFPDWLDLVSEFQSDNFDALTDFRGGLRFYHPISSYGYSELTFDDKSWKVGTLSDWELAFMPGKGWELEIYGEVDVPYNGERIVKYLETIVYGLDLAPSNPWMIRPFVAIQLPDIEWDYREWLFGFEYIF